MGIAVSCPRCGGSVRAPDLMRSEWQCDEHGAVLPLHVPRRIDREILESAAGRVGSARRRMPLWCPWPLPIGWTVTGVGWAGDDHRGTSATAVACSGPLPVGPGPADMLLIAEEPGVGLGARFAGLRGPDPGEALAGQVASTTAQARVRADGRPAPLWVLDSPDDRSGYAGEACGLWLYVVTWPAAAGYLLAEDLILTDLAEAVPLPLGFGAPSPYLHGQA